MVGFRQGGGANYFSGGRFALLDGYDPADKTFDLKPQQPHNRLLTSRELSRQFNPNPL